MTISSNIRLTLINSMLRTIGTAPLASGDEEHPDYITADAVLTDVIEEISSKPMWFNHSKRILYPDTDGRIAVPNNAVSVDTVSTIDNIAVRDRYLFNVDTRTYNIGVPLECYIHSELELADMPVEVTKFIRAQARYQFYLDEDGGDRKLRQYERARDNAEMVLDVVNIARMDINWFNSASARSFFTPRPSGYQHIGGYTRRSS